MKKTIISVVSIVLSLGLFLSCKSTQITLGNHAPTALVAVNGNASITWVVEDEEEDDASGVLSTVINKTLNPNNPEYTTGLDRLDYAEGALLSALSEIAGLEVIDKETVVSAKNYKYIPENVFSFVDSSLHADGYRQLNMLGAKTARMLMQEIGAKSLIIAEFTSQKQYGSNGIDHNKVEAKVTLKIKMYDERGKEVLNKEYVSFADQTVKVVRNIYDKDELVALFPNAIDNAINQFIMSNM